MPVKQQKRRRAVPEAAPAPVSRPWIDLTFVERHSLRIVLAFLFIATVRIVATYNVFSSVFDEPAHVACGMEWLDKGVYRWEPQHPPLARVAGALGPYLLGIRSQGTPNVDYASMFNEGVAILYHDHHYDRNLAAARAGILPFFWIACLVVYWWGRRYFNGAVAVAAVFLFTFLEPVLAHAGLATTDMALTAFLGAAFLAGVIWIERPSMAAGAILGAAAGLAVASKFSALPYFPAAAALALAFYWYSARPSVGAAFDRVRRLIPSAAVAVVTASLLVWACYRFSFGPAGFWGLKLPAPELYQGVRDVMVHNAAGHPGYLLGHRSLTGYWYYYFVVLAFKTPLPYLALAGAGIVMLLRRRLPFRAAWLPLAYALGVLAVALFSHINIGVRHILPIYTGLSLLAGAALVRLLEMSARRQWAKYAAAAAVLWFAGASLLSHPDYLPYFNELAGSHPENILVDSDLDWGQDYKRLAVRLRELGAKQLNWVAFAPAKFDELGFPPVGPMGLGYPPPGWSATGFTMWKERRLGLNDEYPNAVLWPDIYMPTEKVGKSIYLWYFPPAPPRR